MMAEEQRLTLFLEILAAAGGKQDAGDHRWNWINAFCSEHEGSEPDTFNRAHDLGYTTVSHDSDADHSVVYITQSGRGFLTRPTPTPSASEDKVAVSDGARTNALNATARRNLSYYIKAANFKCEADRNAALACLSVIEDEIAGLTDLVAALRSAFAASGSVIHRRERQAAEARWQPIETAPRDGTPFIAALTVRNIKTGQSWQETHVIWSDDETDEIANECERGWSRVDDYEWWMPIPAIRSTEVGKGAQ